MQVCKDCWTKYVNANINDRNQIAELRCPALTAADKPCQYLAVRSLISRIVDPTTLKQLDNHENDLLVNTNPRAAFCPGAGCERAALVVGGARSVQRCDLGTYEYRHPTTSGARL